MNRRQLIEAIMAHAQTIIPRSHVDAVLDGLTMTIQKGVAGDKPVLLPGIGKFAATQRSSRVGRNPSTGERITIQGKRIPRFTPVEHLKQVCNGEAEPSADFDGRRSRRKS